MSKNKKIYYDSFEDEYVQPIVDIIEKDYDSEDSVSPWECLAMGLFWSAHPP